MLLYHKYNLVMTENAKIGSNPCVVMLTAIRGGGRNPINTSIELVDLFTYTSGGNL